MLDKPMTEEEIRDEIDILSSRIREYDYLGLYDSVYQQEVNILSNRIHELKIELGTLNLG